MPGNSTSQQNTIPPSHQHFRWIHGPRQHEALADFVELAKDISAGVNTCLDIIYASDLIREQNADADADGLSAPAVGKADAARLFRLSIAATALLRQAADERIDWLNTAHRR